MNSYSLDHMVTEPSATGFSHQNTVANGTIKPPEIWLGQVFNANTCTHCGTPPKNYPVHAPTPCWSDAEVDPTLRTARVCTTNRHIFTTKIELRQAVVAWNNDWKTALDTYGDIACKWNMDQVTDLSYVSTCTPSPPT